MNQPKNPTRYLFLSVLLIAVDQLSKTIGFQIHAAWFFRTDPAYWQLAETALCSKSRNGFWYAAGS